MRNKEAGVKSNNPTGSGTGSELPANSDISATSAADGKAYKDEETLRRLYHGEGLTTREIAARLGCTNGTISRWMDKHGIETDPNWKAGVEAAKRANRKERVTLRTLESGYEYWNSSEWRPGDKSRTSAIVYVHRLLAVAEFGFDAVADADVHHRNNVPWDNRPGNVQVLSKAEHARRGNEQRISDEELLDEIRRLDALVDGRPTTRDLRERGVYSHPTYKGRFGGWPEALATAGVVSGGDAS